MKILNNTRKFLIPTDNIRENSGIINVPDDRVNFVRRICLLSGVVTIESDRSDGTSFVHKYRFSNCKIEPSCSRPVSLSSIGTDECRKLRISHSRYLFLYCQHPNLSRCFYRDKKIQNKSYIDDYCLWYSRTSFLLSISSSQKPYLTSYKVRILPD